MLLRGLELYSLFLNSANKELIYKEDALKQLRLNDKDVIYIDKQEAAERIRKIPAKQIEIKKDN